jgi:hypothetical protein
VITRHWGTKRHLDKQRIERTSAIELWEERVRKDKRVWSV